MAKDKELWVYVAAYDNVDAAKTDLDAIEQLHKEDLIGMFDAAVVDNEKGKGHIVERMDRPMVRVIPERLGFGTLKHKELKAAGAELTGTQAGLIMVGEPTLEKAFGKAVTHATKSAKHILDATADEVAIEMREAVGT